MNAIASPLLHQRRLRCGLLWLAILPAGVLAQTCPEGLARNAPDERYTPSTLSGDAVVVDSQTGLMWKRCTQGRSGENCATDTVRLLDWASALAEARNEVYAGFDDWRLPNAAELLSLVEYGCHSPSINGTLFPATTSYKYWTSTSAPYAAAEGSAIAVLFDYGVTQSEAKYGTWRVRLVRGGGGLAAFASAGDATPDAFTLVDQVDVAPNTLIISDAVTVTGLTTVASIAVSGAADAAYAINTGDFVSTPGVVHNGDSVRVRHTSAAGHGGTVDTNLSIGGVSDTFTTTSLVPEPPGAPGIGTASAGDGSATVDFSAPESDGGSPITGYSAASDPVGGSSECNLDTFICTINGLVNGTSYRFTVTASNAIGSGPASAPSDSVIPKAAQSIVFGSPPSLVVDGTGTLTASGGGSGNPVEFSSLSPSVCEIAAGNGGSGDTVRGSSVGTCSIAANQAGSAAFHPAPQVTQDFPVGQGSQSIGYEQPTSKTFGDAPFNVTVSGGFSGQPVTLASQTTGVCTTSGTDGLTVTLVGAGTCTLRASQAGNANYLAAPDVDFGFSVAKASQTISFGDAPSLLVGGSGTLSASGGGSGNPVLFSSQTTTICTVSGDNGSTVAAVAAGTCRIAANQAGTSNYLAAAQTIQEFSIGQASQTISFEAPPDQTFGAAPFTLTASGGASGNPVTFASQTTGVCTTGGTHGATVTLVGAGSCTLRASQAGNANYTAAPDVDRSFAVAKASQAINFGDPPAVQVGGSANLTASGGGSGNPVVFSSLSTGICSVSGSNGSTVTGVSVGTCSIAADQAGDADFLPAPQQTQAFEVGKGSQTIDFPQPADRPLLGGSFTVSASGGLSGNPVTFASLTVGVCTSGGSHGATITPVTSGTCTLRASQAGSDNYFAASDVERSLSIVANTPPTIAFSESPRTRFPEDHREPVISPSNYSDHRLVISDLETAATNLIVSASSSNPSLLPNDGITLRIGNLFSGCGANSCGVGGLLRPAADANGSTTITYTVSDGTHSSSVEVAVQFDPINDPPSASYGGSVRMPEAPDADTYSVPGFVVSSSPGPANEAGQVVSHLVDRGDLPGISLSPISNPAIDESGTLSYTIQYLDSGSFTTLRRGVFTFAVAPIDDGPSIRDVSRCASSNGFTGIYLISSYDVACGQTHTFSIVLGDAAAIGLSVFKTFDGTASKLQRKGEAEAQTRSYRIEVLNLGGVALQGARLSVPAPAGLLDPTWTCTAPIGVCSPASGSGAISTSFDLGIDSGVDDRAIIELTGSVDATATWVQVNASASLPPGVSGEIEVDNQLLIEAVSPNGVFIGTFEGR